MANPQLTDEVLKLMSNGFQEFLTHNLHKVGATMKGLQCSLAPGASPTPEEAADVFVDALQAFYENGFMGGVNAVVKIAAANVAKGFAGSTASKN